MAWYEQLRMIDKFRERLWDEESKKIYDARIEYLIDRNRSKLFDTLYEIDRNKPKKSNVLEEFMRNRDKGKVIIFGAGKKGKETKGILEKMDIFPKYFCDNNSNLWGKNIEGIKVLNPEDLAYFYRDYCIILASLHYSQQMYQQLIMNFFPQGNIFYPRGGILVAGCGRQYFDFEELRPVKGEIFVDAGAYNGETAKEFAKWAEQDFERIYLFEPNARNMCVCRTNLAELGEKVVYVNKGTWSEKNQLCFNLAGPASKIVDSGKNVVEVIDIDTVLDSKRASFIKMDVEGAELQTLKGAEKTIRTWMPKLAVCLYHKPEDVIEIPAYLMSITKDYRYAIRHYSTDASETVLYAWT